jgi:hypothetical protein
MVFRSTATLLIIFVPNAHYTHTHYKRKLCADILTHPVTALLQSHMQCCNCISVDAPLNFIVFLRAINHFTTTKYVGSVPSAGDFLFTRLASCSSNRNGQITWFTSRFTLRLPLRTAQSSSERVLMFSQNRFTLRTKAIQRLWVWLGSVCYRLAVNSDPFWEDSYYLFHVFPLSLCLSRRYFSPPLKRKCCQYEFEPKSWQYLSKRFLAEDLK